MSDFHAIGGVSATLRALLLDRMEFPDGITGVPVTIGPPPFSAKDSDQHKEAPKVNLFLYRVTENGYLQNQEIPGRNSPAAYGHPPLSLNLHYLVTAYGNVEITNPDGSILFDDTNAHFLLGSAMRVLHDVPTVAERLMTTKPPSGTQVMHPALRGAFERMKTTLEPLTLEDITKVWTALAQRYRLSAGYAVNVVQIESRRAARVVRPVGQPASSTPPIPGAPPTPGPIVHVLTIQTPTITELRVRHAGVERPFPYAAIGDTLIMLGTNLAGHVTHVRIDGVVVPAVLAFGDRVEAVIPDATVPGGGAIPPELRLQPGVRAAAVIVSDPLIPQSNFQSNESAFMLVPSITTASLVYAAGPPRTLSFTGIRLIDQPRLGETVIGRTAVPRLSYLSATPTAITVPIPDELPTRGVHAIVGNTLALDPIPLTAGLQSLTITIGATSVTIAPALISPVPRDTVAAILTRLIHDALPANVKFLTTRVTLWKNQLVVVPGGLTDAISITSPTGALAGDLGLTAAPLPGSATALVSGALAAVPQLSSATPRLRMTVGAQPPITFTVANTLSLDALAVELQTKINASGVAAEYINAVVATTGSQLLVIPGAAGLVTFDASPGDTTTVVELQLHARFAVRVRVNGAESIDDAVVELPQ